VGPGVDLRSTDSRGDQNGLRRRPLCDHSFTSPPATLPVREVGGRPDELPSVPRGGRPQREDCVSPVFGWAC
jgi:hypothetical protein